MDSNTTILLIKALDCLSTRSVVTAQNIANAGTPNYRPSRVSFERALADAATQGGDAVRNFSPQVEIIPLGARDGAYRMDLELATATTTAQRYGGLVDLLDRQLRMEELAVTGQGR